MINKNEQRYATRQESSLFVTQREDVTKSQNSAGGLVTRRDVAWAETGETFVRGIINGEWPVK